MNGLRKRPGRAGEHIYKNRVWRNTQIAEHKTMYVFFG